MGKALGLRAEIVIQLILLFGAALLLGGFLLLKLTERELLEQRATSLAATMEILGRAYGAARPGSPTGLPPLLQALPATSPLDGWCLVDRDLAPLDGKLQPVRAEFSRARFQPAPTMRLHYLPQVLPFGSARADDYLLVTMPLLAQGEFTGGLQARFTLADVRQRMASARRLVFIYAFLYGAVLTAAGAWLLHRAVVRPLQRLLVLTGRVSGGDLEQMEPEAGPREIAELVVLVQSHAAGPAPQPSRNRNPYPLPAGSQRRTQSNPQRTDPLGKDGFGWPSGCRHGA